MTDEARQKPPFATMMAFEYGVLQQLEPGLRRLVCQNPSDFTFKGTNCYVVGESEVAVVDPGPAEGSHIDELLAALYGERVTHIVLTHCHSDHSGAVEALRERTGAITCGMPRTVGDPAVKARSPSGKRFIVPVEFDEKLDDGSSVEGRGWTLDAVATPGHAPDHLCFGLRGTGIFLSGDHVMGWNTTVIAPPEGHMGRYMASLERLLDRSSDRVYYPGHGGSIVEPLRCVRALLIHRRMRESEVLEQIRLGNSTIGQLLPKIYSGIQSSLSGAASLALFAQVEWLVERGLVTTTKPGPLTPAQEFAIAAPELTAG